MKQIVRKGMIVVAVSTALGAFVQTQRAYAGLCRHQSECTLPAKNCEVDGIDYKVVNNKAIVPLMAYTTGWYSDPNKCGRAWKLNAAGIKCDVDGGGAGQLVLGTTACTGGTEGPTEY